MTLLLQVVRVPLLAGLLLAAGPSQVGLARAVSRLDVAAVWLPWLVLVGLALAFLVGAVVGRDAPQPVAVLAVEGLLAAVVGLTPPFVWIRLLGFGVVAEGLGATTGNLFTQALALAWLVIVAAAAVRQARAS